MRRRSCEIRSGPVYRGRRRFRPCIASLRRSGGCQRDHRREVETMEPPEQISSLEPSAVGRQGGGGDRMVIDENPDLGVWRDGPDPQCIVSTGEGARFRDSSPTAANLRQPSLTRGGHRSERLNPARPFGGLAPSR